LGTKGAAVFTATSTLNDHVNGVLTSHHRKVILFQVLFHKMICRVRESVQVFDEWSRGIVDDCAVVSPGEPLYVVYTTLLV
jgi:hypothetical protein